MQSNELNMIFVGGSPRSGTTLVQNILDSHSAICGGPEFDFLPSVMGLRDALQSGVKSGRINEYLSEVELDSKVSAFVESLFHDYAVRNGCKIISEKTPFNVFVIRQLLEVFPVSKALLTVRDPRAIISSMLKVGKRAKEKGESYPPFTATLEGAIGYVKEVYSHIESVCNHPRIQLVSYEDLIAKPGESIEYLCDFLGIDFEKSMLRPGEQHHAGEQTLDGVWYDRDSYYRNIDDSSLHRWKSDLSVSQVSQINKAFATNRFLNEQGYSFESSVKLASACQDSTLPRVSVVITSYNHDAFIDEAIRSIVEQTYRNWNLIVVDDGSRDNSAEKILAWQEKYPDRITSVIKEKNGGVTAALNTALELADGEYVAFLASDDVANPERFGLQVHALEADDGLGAVCSRISPIDESGNELEGALPVFDIEIKNLRLQLLDGNFLNAPTFMVRKSVLDEVGPFREYRYVQDFDYWLRILDKYDICRLDERLVQYRCHQGNVSVGDGSDEATNYAAHYETVVAILEAVQRWPIEKIFQLEKDGQSPASGTLLSRAYERLARICLGVDQRYFNGPHLGTAAAYRLALSSIAAEPVQSQGYALLNDVYRLLGDVPRSKGKGFVSLKEWYSQDKNRAASENFDPDAGYEQWREKHYIRETDVEIMVDRLINKWMCQPSVDFLICANEGELDLLQQTLNSLSLQAYSEWRVTVLSPQSCPFEDFSKKEKLRWICLDEPLEHHLHGVISKLDGDWVSILEPGCTFDSVTLLKLADYINLKPGVMLFYSDEDVSLADGRYGEVRFKPDFDLELLRSTPYLGSLCLVRREIIESLGGVDERKGMANYDLALRVYDVYGADAFFHIPDVLVHRDGSQSERELTEEDETNFLTVLAEHLVRNDIQAEVSTGYRPGTSRIEYLMPFQPATTVIVSSCNDADVLYDCLESLVQATDYQNYEIIYPASSALNDSFATQLSSRAKHGSVPIKAIALRESPSRAEELQMLAAHAQGECLILVQPEIRFAQGQWMQRLVARAMRADVGAVSPRLLNTESNVVYAGGVLGYKGVVGEPYEGRYFESDGYLQVNLMDHGVSSVSKECFAVRAAVFAAANGFVSESLPEKHYAVEFSLRLLVSGLRNLYTPYVNLVKIASVVGQSETEIPSFADVNAEDEYMLSNWLQLLANDPAYNPNLSLRQKHVQVDTYLVPRWESAIHDRPRIVGVPLTDTAVGEIRVISPLNAIDNTGVMTCMSLPPLEGSTDAVGNIPSAIELARLNPDTVLMQSTVAPQQLQAMEHYRRFNKSFMVFDLEDLKTALPEKNTRLKYMPKDIEGRLKYGLSLCDRLLVTTEPLAEAHKHDIDDIRVVPNYLSKTRWQQVKSLRGTGHKPRVGWAGAQQHHGDLEYIIDVVKATSHEVDWIFMGMCLDELKPHVKEVHEFVPYQYYPEKLAALNLDLAIAPLENHPFNEAKSNLRLLEYGILGWPVVCTDIYPYQNAPVKRVNNDVASWVSAIRERIHDLDAAAAEGDALKAWVMQNYMLEDHLDTYLQALLP